MSKEKQETINEEVQEVPSEENKSFADKFREFDKTAKDLKISLPACARLVGHMYIRQNLIEEHEYADVVRDMGYAEKGSFNEKVLAFFRSFLGMCVCPLIIKCVEHISFKIDCATSIDSFEQQYEEKIFNKLLNK